MLVLIWWSDQSNCCGHGLRSFLYRENWAPFLLRQLLTGYYTSQMKMKTRLIHKICPRQVFSYSRLSNNCSITYMIKECPPSPTCLSQQPSPWTVPLFFSLAHVRNLTISFLPPLHVLSVILAMTLSPWYLSLSPTVLHLPDHCEFSACTSSDRFHRHCLQLVSSILSQRLFRNMKVFHFAYSKLSRAPLLALE